MEIKITRQYSEGMTGDDRLIKYTLTDRGSDEAVITSLFRVKGPEMLNSGLVRFKFMEGLKSVPLLKGTQGV